MKNKLDLPDFNGGKMLEGIFALQLELVARYQIKGMLPDLDLDMNSSETARFLRELVGWITEEVMEADSDAQKILDQMNRVLVDEGDWLNLKTSQTNYTKELSDVMSFMVELMIYTKIDPEDVNGYIRQLCKINNLPIMTSDGLESTFRYAVHTNFYENSQVVDIRRRATKRNTSPELTLGQLAGIQTSEDFYTLQSQYTMKILSKLWLGINFLKKKPWVEGQRPFVNMASFQENIMEAFVWFMCLCELVGLDAKGIYYNYVKVNNLNHERLNNKY